MRVLVTGGAGFIGSNFLLHSVPRHPEHEFLNVDALTYAANVTNLASLRDSERYSFRRLDIADRASVDRCFAAFEPELVVHFAAESHVDRSIRDPLRFLRSNVEGTLNLLDACRDASTQRQVVFHHVSTDEVFGSIHEGAFTEQTAYAPSSPYAASKAASDHFVRAYHKTYGLQVRITNCSNNYGPYQFPEKLIPLMIVNALERKPLPVYGDGSNVRDWLYVEDHCRAIWAVLGRGQIGATYNVGGNCELRNIDLVETLCDVLETELSLAKGELRRLITFVEDRSGHDLRYAIDATRIQTECGFEPLESMGSGLLKTVRWYLANQAWLESVKSGEYRAWMRSNYELRSKASS